MIQTIILYMLASLVVGFLFGYIVTGKTDYKSIYKIIMDFFVGIIASILSTFMFGYEIGLISYVGLTFAEMVGNWLYVVISIYVILFIIGASIGDYFEKKKK